MTHSVDDLWQALVRASVDRKHPWRVAGFCTQSAQGPSSRSVILRKVFPSARQLVFFTDIRSEKIRDIADCQRVAVLFWNPNQNLQLRSAGTAAVLADPVVVDQYWQTIPDYARRDYGSVDAPGAVLSSSAEGGYDLSVSRQHFAVLTIELDKLDCLQLSRDEHQRQRFTWDAEQLHWADSRLVP
jgi:pyridoxamine 5'-phosphate oxidase